MHEFRLEKQLPAQEVDKLGGTLMGERAFDLLLTAPEHAATAERHLRRLGVEAQVAAGAADVYKPNGDPLVRWRPGVLPAALCEQAYRVLRKAAQTTDNRGLATGRVDDKDLPRLGIVRVGTAVAKFRPIKKDGTLSRQSVAKTAVESGIVGYFDRTVRNPYCRLTAFNLEHFEEFQRAMPFVRAVDRVFRENAPDRYQAQLEVVRRTSPDFYIHGTAFTTITVNRNFRTALHKDVGDLREGFGVMTVLQAGRYEGCYLVWPQFRVAVDMRTGCVCLADVHEWHGNTPLRGVPGLFERVSLVFYYREKMQYCGTAEQELQLAKTRQSGSPIMRVRPGEVMKT